MITTILLLLALFAPPIELLIIRFYSDGPNFAAVLLPSPFLLNEEDGRRSQVLDK